MSRACSSMHTTQQVEDPSSSRRVGTSLNLLKTESNIIRKIDMINCTPEALFLALAHIEHEIAWMSIQGEDGKEISLSTLASLSDFYTLTSVSDIHSEAQFL
jgi:hypothetical protein